jgi:hypothetical protein
LFFLPPNEFWYLTVARLEVSFDDNSKGSGTGFFVYDEKNYFLITARHVVDASYDPKKAMRRAKLTQMDMCFQAAVDPGTPRANIGYQRLSVRDPDVEYESDDVDVAVIKIPATVLPIRKAERVIRPCSFPTHFLATEVDLAARYAGEPVVFLGFPENAPVNRFEEMQCFYPILRQGVFAYPPIHGIDIAGEFGRNYGLIDSFAQSGFSGGPIISLQKGWADGSWHPKEDHRPPQIVGLICGHYRSREDRSDGVHAGLSFFARSTSIISTIQKLQFSVEAT